MYARLKQYWQWYSSLGVMPHHDEVHRRKVVFANRFLSFCIVLIAILGISEICTNKYWVLPMHVARILGLAFALLQLYRDRYFLSVYISLYTIFVFSIVGTLVSPVDNSFHFIVFPLCGISFYLTEGRRGNLPFVVLNLLYFTFADYYNAVYLPEDTSLSHVVSIIITFFVFYVIISIYVWEFRFFEKVIANKNENLVKQNIQLAEQNDQMTDLNKLKNNLFSILGHDLRSPFNNIVGFSNLLQRNFKKNTPEKNEHLIQLLVDSVQQTSQLIDDLLYWGSCQGDKIEIRKEVIVLSPLFQDLCLMYQNMINNKGVFVNILHLQVKECVSDRTILTTIIRNLFANAIKFTQKNGTITFTSQLIDNQVVIVVSDTGLGMSSDKIRQLESAQAASPGVGTNNEIGYGFGLRICIELAQKIGARISFESEIEKGTIVRVFLPKNGI